MNKLALAFASVCFGSSLLAADARVRLATGGLLILAAAFADRRSLTAFGSWKLWLFPLLFIVASPLFLGEPRTSLLGLPYSPEQLGRGALFLFHAYCFVVFGALVSGAFSLREVMRASERLGMGGVGLRVALGPAAAKIVSRMVRETWATYRMERPSLLPAARDCLILFGAIARNTALIAERISILFYLRNVRVGAAGRGGRGR
ncbi:MAG: hypothetical protein IT574_03630 [Candidatus Aureabacteria bacterium]|nr:hypothetical protein [Candidatus Auribacterota bacterium]NLW94516.1 hypothetical protein [Chlamydiota bacterium]HOE26433.1 hypothetical protein [bacterium]HQM51981.1 hypothetical protein [bacterium]